jgi:hypothetical protein
LDGKRNESIPAHKLVQQASSLVEVFRGHAIDLFDHPDSIRDLKRLRVGEASYPTSTATRATVIQKAAEGLWGQVMARPE